MNTLLKIQASISGANGHSTRLADRFAAQWLERNPWGTVVTRDIAAEPVPHLTAERMQALSTPPGQRSAEQNAVVEYSDTLIAELNNADVIVLAVPMYNFSVPSTLRAYFDHIARSGVTFRYGAAGPEGLIKGKTAYVMIARGGVYAAAEDTQTAYLRQFLSFIGITDLHFVHAEGLAMNAATRDQSLHAAHETIARLAPLARAA